MLKASRRTAEAAAFFSGIPCPDTRAALLHIFATYQKIGLILSARGATHLVEVGPGAFSVAALALAGRRSTQPLTYIGLERDSSRADKLRMFLQEYYLKGEVKTISFFDLDFRSLLPEGRLVLCHEHSLEDLVLADLAETLGIYERCWTHVISSLEVRALKREDRKFAAAALGRVFSAMESLSLERPETMSLVHHFSSPRYEGTTLQWLDTEVRDRSWGALTARYETMLSFQPESVLSNEFWWLGRMIQRQTRMETRKTDAT